MSETHTTFSIASTIEAIDDFLQLTRFAATRWGKYVDWWITVNEAEVFVFHGWLRGIFPPGKTDFAGAVLALSHVMKAHALAYHLIKELDTIDADGDGLPAQVGIAQLFVPYEAASVIDPVETTVAYVLQNFSNTFWLIANQTGILDLRLPLGPQYVEEFPRFQNSLDFIGVNYYSRQIARFDLLLGFRFSPPEGAVVSDLDIEVYPRGLYESLQTLSQFKVPIIITENGIADADDSRRFDYITGHLSELSRFMADRPDVPVLGYIHWALTDNFEWENGYAPRYGLVEVDYATQKRTVRPSAVRFAQLLTTLRGG